MIPKGIPPFLACYHINDGYFILCPDQPLSLSATRISPSGLSPARLLAGRLTLIGAKPGIGKTSWLIRMVREAAQQGISAALAYYEHTEKDSSGVPIYKHLPLSEVHIKM